MTPYGDFRNSMTFSPMATRVLHCWKAFNPVHAYLHIHANTHTHKCRERHTHTRKHAHTNMQAFEWPSRTRTNHFYDLPVSSKTYFQSTLRLTTRPSSELKQFSIMYRIHFQFAPTRVTLRANQSENKITNHV